MTMRNFSVSPPSIPRGAGHLKLKCETDLDTKYQRDPVKCLTGNLVCRYDFYFNPRYKSRLKSTHRTVLKLSILPFQPKLPISMNSMKTLSPFLSNTVLEYLNTLSQIIMNSLKIVILQLQILDFKKVL